MEFKFNLYLGLMLLFISGVSAYSAPAQENIIDLPTAKIFAPVGFDDNDNVEVVLDGMLPGSCYRLLTPTIHVDLIRKKIIVQPKAQVTAGGCAELPVRYSLPVELGMIEAGHYSVSTEKEDAKASIDITHAINLLSDNYFYAAINGVSLTQDREGQFVATLEGRYPDSCLTMGNVKVSLTGDTIEVLPILKVSLAEEHGICEAAETPFTYSVKLPDLSPGRYLLHVRSLNGHALNYVFSTP